MEYRHLIGLQYAPPFGCFQLVRRFLSDNGLLKLPDFAESVSEHEKAHALLTILPEYAYQVEQPDAGDVVLLSSAGMPAHIGIIVAPGEMLHSTEGHHAAVERINSTKWQRRVAGYWRVYR